MSGFSSISSRSLRRLSAVGLLLTALLFACGEDGIDTAPDGELDIVPDPVTFSDTPIGESETETVELINDSDQETTITLSNLALEEDPARTGSHEAFELVDPWDGELELTPDNDASNPATLDIEFQPEVTQDYNALVTFDTNLADRERVELEIEAPSPEPELVAEESLALERVPGDTSHSRTTEISNIGEADLEIDDISVAEGSANFDVQYPRRYDDISQEELDEHLDEDEQDAIPDDAEYAGPTFDQDEPPETLAPDESMLIRVYFHAPNDEFHSGELHIQTNDPNTPRHIMILTANSEAACLEVAEGSVDFGLASLNNTSQQTATLNNCSTNTDTVVTDIALGSYDEEADEFDEDADIPFEIDDDSLPEELTEGNNKVLDPDDSISLTAMYTPTAEEQHEATLRLESNDDASPLHIDVMGEGVDRECPVAIAEASPPDSGVWSEEEVSGVPLDVIEFDGGESYSPADPDEEMTFEWYVADGPDNSTATIDNHDTATPTLTTDIAGHYVVELMVYDELGIGACEPARIEIFIEPGSDIHVELTWSVPAADDGVGTDLDLHYLHPDGNWSEADLGVYYANPDPDWEDGSEISLDIDDLTGEEPENIHHDNPAPGVYSTGVYYFGDSLSYGATDAVVRIYLYDDLVYEGEQRLEDAGTDEVGAGDFWHVADFDVTAAAINFEEIDEFHDDAGFPDASD